MNKTLITTANLRRLCVFMVFLALAFAATTVSAALITETLPEFNGTHHDIGDTYPLPPVHVGDFNYVIPLNNSIISATISGQWGNSEVPTSARNEIYADGIKVADTAEAPEDPYYNKVPWSFSYTDFSSLTDGHVSLDAVQTSEFILRFGVTTLTIETQAVPEPSTLAMLAGLGVMLAVGYIRRRGRS
ncbi:MAG: PEP-CTERM sorting domain-containing protein [Thermoguttaceae bacterium]